MTNLNNNVEFIGTDNNYMNKSVVHWFNVDGDEWGVDIYNGETTSLVDCDGCPVVPCNDHGGVLDLLLPLIPQEDAS